MNWRIRYTDEIRDRAIASSRDNYQRMQALVRACFEQLLRNVGVSYNRIDDSPYFQFLLTPRKEDALIPRWFVDVIPQFHPIDCKISEQDIRRKMKKLYVPAVIMKREGQVSFGGFITPSRLDDYESVKLKGRWVRRIPVYDLIPCDDIFDLVLWEHENENRPPPTALVDRV